MLTRLKQLTHLFPMHFSLPLKISENRKVFCCFQGLEKGCIGNKWVNKAKTSRCMYLGVSETQFKENYRNCKKSFSNTSHQNLHNFQKYVFKKFKVYNKVVNSDYNSIKQNHVVFTCVTSY